MRKNVVVLIAFCMFQSQIGLGQGRFATVNSPEPKRATARILIEASASVAALNGDLFGTNFSAHRNDAAETSDHLAFIDSTKRINPTLIRWPGGSISDFYDWKSNEVIEAGRRKSNAGHVNLEDIVVFSRKVGAELTITVNFGTMTAEDAADLVEFCNGSATTFWGQKRDSILTRNGLAPGALNVRYFEVGNETHGRHTFEHSWTAQHPAQYFLGGEAERRGGFIVDIDGVQVRVPLGDLFEIRANDGNHPVYYLHFPPVKNVTIHFIPDRAALENCLFNGVCNFEQFTAVQSLQGQPPTAKVFVLDSLAGALQFGDGVQGFKPPVGSFILAEYTTFGHDGFVEFARQMRRVQSSVPIKIGAAMLPEDPRLNKSTHVPQDSLPAVFAQMDFLVIHHYLPTNSPNTATYVQRRQAALDRVLEQRDWYEMFRQASFNALGYEKEIGLGVTEWNLFNKSDSLVRRNRALEGAVSGAEWLIRTMNALAATVSSQNLGATECKTSVLPAIPQRRDGTPKHNEVLRTCAATPVWYAEQFDLAAWESKFALVETETGLYRLAPLGYVFEMLKSWRGAELLRVEVDSPELMAHDKAVALIQAAATKSASGDTLFVLITNNTEHDSIPCVIDLKNFNAARVALWGMSGSSPQANNDAGNDPVLLVGPIIQDSLKSFVMPPHAIAFLQIYSEGTTSVSEPKSHPPAALELEQNYPNPFNPATVIRFQLPVNSHVTLKVFDALGREVATLVNGAMMAGEHHVPFAPRDLAGGLYFYKLTAGQFTQTRKAVLVK